VPAAAAVELVHNFSLVHDDIEDNSLKRYDRPAVWKVWGAAQAINVGDSLHALSRLTLQRMSEAGVSADRVLWATRLLDEATLHLCEGQSLDIMYQETADVSIEDYYTMVRGKTAALIACAMQLGGIVATGDAGIVDTLGEAGMSLGTAFQIHDDVLDVVREKETPAGDITERKKTYPVVYALEKGTPQAREELRRIYRQGKLSQKDVERVISILRETQSVRFAREASRVSYDEAIATYEHLPIGNGLKTVQQIARFMVERDR
jgi:geranylgeranyl diphosphate synthase type I